MKAWKACQPGWSLYVPGGHANLYYQYRIEAAVRLYQADRIQYILISGDNALKAYNEPAMIQKDLLKRGIPKHHIYLDYAGFDTFDSIVRAREVFGQQQLTVISQRFQNERAIYIGRQLGMEVVGYSAQAVDSSIKVG